MKLQLRSFDFNGDNGLIVVFGFSGCVLLIIILAFTQSLDEVPSFTLNAAVQFSPLKNLFVAFSVNVYDAFVAFVCDVLFALKCSTVMFLQKTISTVIESASGSDTNEDAFKLEFVLIMLSVANGCANIYGVALFGTVLLINTDAFTHDSEFIIKSFVLAAQVQF